MRSVLSVAIGIVVLAAGAAATAAGDDAWKPLFNGKDLDGWTVKAKPEDKAKNFWKVEDGTILADSLGHKGHNYVWLVTDEEYDDFVLRLKFQAYRPDVSPGNTGVQIRSRYDDEAYWLDGPQIDINPPGPWRTGMIWDETRGSKRWLWPEVPKGKWVDEKMANPKLKFVYAGEGDGWNDLEISAVGTELKAVLNGVTVMEWDGAGVLDDEVHRERNVGMKGHIALQIHTGDQLKVRYKDIAIREK